MKKIVFILCFFVLTSVLYGCSFAPSEKKEVGRVSKFTLSKSIWKYAGEEKGWEAKNEGIGKANINEIEVLSMTINPFDKDNAYVGLRKGGILETKNGGDEWSFINFQSEKVYGLELDPSNGKTLYASGVWKGRGKMFKTENGGEDWKEIYTSPAQGPLIIALAIDKKNPQVIYASTSENETIKSIDGGKSWKNVSISKNPVIKISIDSENNNFVYLMTNAGNILRSKDRGDSFEDITEKTSDSYFGFGQGKFNVLEVEPTLSGKLYLAGSGGIISSSDFGETWEKILVLNNPENFPIRSLAINPKNSQEIVYSMSQATYKSIDGGINWKTSQFDTKMKVNILKYDPSGSNELYLGFIK